MLLLLFLLSGSRARRGRAALCGEKEAEREGGRESMRRGRKESSSNNKRQKQNTLLLTARNVPGLSCSALSTASPPPEWPKAHSREREEEETISFSLSQSTAASAKKL